MEKQQPHYAKTRRTLLILFLLSTLVFVLLFLGLSMLTLAPGQGPGDSSTDVLGIGALIATATSCLTSVTTFIGFISTTILALRREKRETRKTELESKRQEIELEKTRLELEKLKRAGAPQEGGREMLKHRRELIQNWRKSIDEFDFDSDNFGNTSTYAAMRPHMRKEAIAKFEAQRTVYVAPDGGRGDNLPKQWALDEVARIEQEWGLL